MVQFCLSLIGLYLVFIIAIDRTCPKIYCTIAAALMHYFILTTMAWMAVEARYLYIKLVKTVSVLPDGEGFVKRAALGAWGRFNNFKSLSVDPTFPRGLSYEGDVYECHCHPPKRGPTRDKLHRKIWRLLLRNVKQC